VDQRRLSVSIKLGRGGDGRSSVFEQAGKYGRDASVGRTSWEGWQAETRTPDAIDPKRAPAEVPLHQLGLSYGDSAGGALGILWRDASNFRLPPSQLVLFT